MQDTDPGWESRMKTARQRRILWMFSLGGRAGKAKHFILAVVVLCLATGPVIVPGAACAEVVDRIIAVVNEDIILLSELNQMLVPYVERVKSAGYPMEQEDQILFKVRSDLLGKMIDEKLTAQEARRLNVIVTEKEIDGTLERIKEANYFTDEDLREMLAQQGLTLEEYRQELRDQALRARLVNIEVKSKIVITKEDILAYQRANPDKYGGDTQYHLQNLMIQVPPGASPAEKNKAKQRMDAIYAQLKAGQPYDKSGTTGMDLGVISSQTLSPQLQTELANLKSGEFTPVLDTDQGYQIFFVKNIESGAQKSQEEIFRKSKRVVDEV